MAIINVGLIGCGGFAKGMHIPILKNNPKYRIHAVMDIIEKAAREVAEDTGVSYWTTDVGKLLSDNEVDVVFIITLHDSHAELSVRTANAGKHVMCEKPMALNLDDCKAVVEAVRRNRVKYTVGYNRGMAPLVRKDHDLNVDKMFLSSDHEVFYKRGIPTVFLNDMPDTLVWDTNLDISRNMCLERMEDAAKIMLGIILQWVDYGKRG